MYITRINTQLTKWPHFSMPKSPEQSPLQRVLMHDKGIDTRLQLLCNSQNNKQICFLQVKGLCQVSGVSKFLGIFAESRINEVTFLNYSKFQIFLFIILYKQIKFNFRQMHVKPLQWVWIPVVADGNFFIWKIKLLNSQLTIRTPILYTFLYQKHFSWVWQRVSLNTEPITQPMKKMSVVTSRVKVMGNILCTDTA
jgi:hypothetical protein